MTNYVDNCQYKVRKWPNYEINRSKSNKRALKTHLSKRNRHHGDKNENDGQTNNCLQILHRKQKAE